MLQRPLALVDELPFLFAGFQGGQGLSAVTILEAGSVFNEEVVGATGLEPVTSCV
jgi:hypothetical protein